MRLKKDSYIMKNVKKIAGKNKSLIEDNQNTKNKYENIYLQNKIKKINYEKIKGKEQFQQIQNNPKIYKPNKKFQMNKKLQNKKITDNNNTNSNNNKTMTIKANNNINIGNNINIINNNISNNSLNGNINNNIILKNNLMNNSQIIKDFKIVNDQSNDDIYENNQNTINSMNYRKSRINDVTGNFKRKFKGKNSSMEQRHRRINKDISLNENELIQDEENTFRRHHIYARPFKNNFSPDSDFNNTYKNKTNIDLRQEILNDNISEIYGNNYYYNKYICENNLTNLNANKKMFYNYFYNKNNYNSLNNDYNKPLTNDSFVDKTKNNEQKNLYKHRSPINTSKDINKKYNNYFNYINNKKHNNYINDSPRRKSHINSVIMDENYKIAPFDNYLNKSNHLVYNTNRRSKNKIRITKSNNPRIIEYNLDISDEEDEEEYHNDFYKINNYNKNLKTNYSTRRNDYENNFKKKYLQKYYSNFSKNLKPIINSQFNIYGNNSNTNISIGDNNNLSNYSSIKNKNNEIDETNSNKIDNNLISTPNFSETGKTPKRNDLISAQRVKSFNININKKINNNNISLNEDNSSKIIIKKRPKNEIPIPSLQSQKKNSSSSKNLNKNNCNIDYKNIEICSIENINYEPIKKMKKKIMIN